MFRSLLLLALVVVNPAVAQPAGFNYDESKVGPYLLPDPLQFDDGSMVPDAAAWQTRRRAELREHFAREVYGRTPAGRPEKMHWAVTSTDPTALGGQAVRKEITIWFSEDKSGPRMHLLIYLPANAVGRGERVPAFLGLNFYGNHCVHPDPGITLSDRWLRPNADHGIVNNRATERTRGMHASGWDVESVVARGYATATVYYGDLCEDRSEGLTRDVAALFHTGTVEERAVDSWGAIGIWAWGLSRALDYLETDAAIDGRRVAVHGHSRLGKTALWAGAQDERFALVISNNSGCGGAALSRRKFGETVARINASFPFWFSRNFRAYDGKEELLPVDQHELLALIAPRPLYVASAEDDKWADPRGEFLGVREAGPVYRLLGRQGLGDADWPPVDNPVHGDAVAYHVRTGRHAITPYDWAQYLDFADRVLK